MGGREGSDEVGRVQWPHTQGIEGSVAAAKQAHAVPRPAAHAPQPPRLPPARGGRSHRCARPRGPVRGRRSSMKCAGWARGRLRFCGHRRDGGAPPVGLVGLLPGRLQASARTKHPAMHVAWAPASEARASGGDEQPYCGAGPLQSRPARLGVERHPQRFGRVGHDQRVAGLACWRLAARVFLRGCRGVR